MSRLPVRLWWLATAIVVGAAVVWLRSGAPLPSRSGARDPGVIDSTATSVVAGIPGWNALSEDDRRRARTPLSDGARTWLRDERVAVRRVAAAFDVSPIALGGIVAAEKTLLVGRVDALGEELFEAIFGSMREEDLERWVADQEAAFQREALGGRAPGSVVRNPYLWTLGPAQVSFRLAIQYEPRVAERLRRPRRSAKAVLEALTAMPGNLEYAAALLVEAQRAYQEIAAIDISGSPSVLATLYHLGAPTVRARRLRDEIAAGSGSADRVEPKVNFYGAFVGHHADEIGALLEIG